ncbi:MAG: hypothetical protein IPP61_17175 [Cytophagaceae bacterium]|nr:hypothetical protein [Cytophagaceae bacterium]
MVLIVCEAVSQICPNPKYFCSNLNVNSDFVTYNSNFSTPTVINDNTFGTGGPNVNWGCITGGIQNETWLLVKVENLDPVGGELWIGTNNHVNINGSIWGPFSTTYFDACQAMFSGPIQCTDTQQELRLQLKNAFSGAYYLVGIRNESNLPDTYYINTMGGETSTTIKHFVPQVQNCELPTAEFVTDNFMIREEERQEFIPKIKFTGTPPFYFTIEDGVYEYTADNNLYDWRHFVHYSESFSIDLATVRNTCGTGKVIKNNIDYLVYSRDRRLVSCIPFDNSLDDQQSGQEFSNARFQYTEDRIGKVNNAIHLNGIDDYLEYSGRDLIGENYLISIWVKPEQISGTSQTILNLGSEHNSAQKLELIQNEFVFTCKLRGNRIYQTRIPSHNNVWQKLWISKDSSKVTIGSNYNHEESITQNDFEVPDYGINSKLFIGKNLLGTNFFTGSIDHFRYLSGSFNNSKIHELANQESCTVSFCDTIPKANLPGFRIDNPGVSEVYENVLFESFWLDRLVYQIGSQIPKITLAWTQNINPNQPYSGSNYSQYTFHMLNNEKYESINHLSGQCGSGFLADTMDFFTSPVQIRCYNFNDNTNDYFSNSTTSVGISYLNDGLGKSVSLNTNSTVSTIIKDGNPRNYSVSFRFKTSNLMVVNQKYEFFDFVTSGNFEDRLFLEKLNGNNYRIVFQKLQENYNFDFIVNNLDNSWHQLVLIFNSGNLFSVGNLKIYLDNKLFIDTKINFIFAYNIEFPFYIGKKTGSERNSFIGLLDDFKIFSGAINDTIVNRLFSSITECQYRICENLPGVVLPPLGEYIVDQGDMLKYSLKFSGRGPFDFKYNINGIEQINDYARLLNSIIPTQRTMPYKSGENYMVLNRIKNHCGLVELNDTIKFYVKPKLAECLPFNNQIIQPNYKGSNSTSVFLDSDRFGNFENAAKFSELSRYEFYDSTLKPTSINFSTWIKAENFDKIVLFRMGNILNYYSIYLLKTQSGLKIVANKNGEYFLNSTLRTFSSNSTLIPGQWYFISVQFLSNGYDIYINQNLDNSIRHQGGQYPSFYNYPLTYSIGSKYDNLNSFVGLMDNIKIISGIPNPQEISSLYLSNSCIFNFCPNSRVIPKTITSNSYYQALNPIETDANINAKTIIYSGKSILLKNGFEAKGTTFTAQIASCPN